jgi:hypothetical protein
VKRAEYGGHCRGVFALHRTGVLEPALDISKGLVAVLIETRALNPLHALDAAVLEMNE